MFPKKPNVFAPKRDQKVKDENAIEIVNIYFVDCGFIFL